MAKTPITGRNDGSRMIVRGGKDAGTFAPDLTGEPGVSPLDPSGHKCKCGSNKQVRARLVSWMASSRAIKSTDGRSEEEASAAPGPTTCENCLAVFTSNAPQSVGGRRSSFPGRPAWPADLCARRTGKRAEVSEKMSSLIFRKTPALFSARKLACGPFKHQAMASLIDMSRTVAGWVQG